MNSRMGRFLGQLSKGEFKWAVNSNRCGYSISHSSKYLIATLIRFPDSFGLFP